MPARVTASHGLWDGDRHARRIKGKLRQGGYAETAHVTGHDSPVVTAPFGVRTLPSQLVD